MPPIAIRLTDTAFPDSPDVGDPECVCSRCGGPILDAAIRAWSAHGDLEYRYHRTCVGVDEVATSDEDDFSADDMRGEDVERCAHGFPFDEDCEDCEMEEDDSDDGPVEDL